MLTANPTTSPQDAGAPTSSSTTCAPTCCRARCQGTDANALRHRPDAAFTDLTDRITDRLPLFIAAVVAMSFLLLMIVFRSVLVPLKAALMNLLSIGAAYGVVVAVFQWGWGNELIGAARARCRSTRSCR